MCKDDRAAPGVAPESPVLSPPDVALPKLVPSDHNDYDLDNNTLAHPLMSPENCLRILVEDNLASISSNRKFDVSSCHDHLRYLVVRRYFEHIQDGMGKMEASKAAGIILRKVPTEHQSIKEYLIAKSGEAPRDVGGKSGLARG